MRNNKAISRHARGKSLLGPPEGQRAPPVSCVPCAWRHPAGDQWARSLGVTPSTCPSRAVAWQAIGEMQRWLFYFMLFLQVNIYSYYCATPTKSKKRQASTLYLDQSVLLCSSPPVRCWYPGKLPGGAGGGYGCSLYTWCVAEGQGLLLSVGTAPPRHHPQPNSP